MLKLFAPKISSEALGRQLAERVADIFDVTGDPQIDTVLAFLARDGAISELIRPELAAFYVYAVTEAFGAALHRDKMTVSQHNKLHSAFDNRMLEIIAVADLGPITSLRYSTAFEFFQARVERYMLIYQSDRTREGKQRDIILNFCDFIQGTWSADGLYSTALTYYDLVARGVYETICTSRLI